MINIRTNLSLHVVYPCFIPDMIVLWTIQQRTHYKKAPIDHVVLV